MKSGFNSCPKPIPILQFYVLHSLGIIGANISSFVAAELSCSILSEKRQ